VLVGAKFDLFLDLEPDDQAHICTLSRRYALAMKSPLVFTSASYSINVQKLFKIVSGLCFGVDCKVERVSAMGEPIIEY
jgi:GTP-binding protein of the ras superfamily involved in termination of M-phase